RKKLIDAVNAYFKAAAKYVDEAPQKHVNWYREMKSFAKTKMLEFLESTITRLSYPPCEWCCISTMTLHTGSLPAINSPPCFLLSILS
ncbi:unnamed protein product, partial [marine sediment metagenome]